MSDFEAEPIDAYVEYDDQDEFDPSTYRSLCTTAVVSLVFGIASILAMLDWLLLVLPATGLLFGFMAILKIRRYPEELSGSGAARAAVGLSLAFAAVGIGWNWYAQISEAPEGYQSISYADLQPGKGDPSADIPRAALDLEGKRIFIKGFMYPGAEKSGIKRFILCRDNGTCCFGGPAPKLTDMVDVKLGDPLEAEYRTRPTRVGGVFHVIRSAAAGGLDAVYHLEADYFR